MSTSIEEKKEYLEQYRLLRSKRKKLMDRKNTLIEAMQNAKAIEYSGMPHSSNGKKKDLSDYVVKLDEYFSDILNIECEMKEIVTRICDLCNECKLDEPEAAVIRKRYIELKGWNRIAREIGKSRMQACRYHGTALQKLKIEREEH